MLAVGVDLATAEARAVALDAAGRELAWGRAPLPQPVSPRPGWWEQDAAAWWPAVVAALVQLTSALGERSASIAAVAVSATSGTVAALDSAGRPCGPALTYADQRATGEAARAGVPATSGLAKWAWLAAHHPSAARLVHAPDVVVGELVGATAPTDWSHALKSGYDPEAGAWPLDSATAAGLDPSRLPEVLRPATCVGTVAPAAAATTGLPVACEVRLGMTDGCAAQLAAGAATPGRFVSVLGTTLVLKGASVRRIEDGTGAVYSHRHPGGWWLPGGASNVGGGALVAALLAGRDLLGMDTAAEARGPARAVVYPLLGMGERFPFAAPGAERFVVGDVADPVELYRAVMEGVAFVERAGFERLADLGAVAEPPVVVMGGGSRSPVWNRIRATVLGKPLLALMGATTARGAALLATAGALHPDLASAAKAMALGGREIEPEDGEREALEDSYRRFLAEVTSRGWG